MDIHQLRSWIFELYGPLENRRQYVIFDAERGNLLVDVPPFSERALRLVRGAGRASLLVVTSRARAADAHRYREALGLQIAAHQDDASAIEGGADVTLGDDQLVNPEVRVIRIPGAAAYVVLAQYQVDATLVKGCSAGKQGPNRSKSITLWSSFRLGRRQSAKPPRPPEPSSPSQ